jgi:hypothetical protein
MLGRGIKEGVNDMVVVMKRLFYRCKSLSRFAASCLGMLCIQVTKNRG